ncbi:rCG55810, partial [Rattus norvegicus]
MVLSADSTRLHRTLEDAPPRRRPVGKRISSKAGGKKNKKQLAFRRELPCSCGGEKGDVVKAMALWIDVAAAAPTHAPRKNSGPGDDQGRVSYPALMGGEADLAPPPAFLLQLPCLRQNDQGTQPVPSHPDPTGYPRPAYRRARVGNCSVHKIELNAARW